MDVYTQKQAYKAESVRRIFNTTQTQNLKYVFLPHTDMAVTKLQLYIIYLSILIIDLPEQHFTEM